MVKVDGKEISLQEYIQYIHKMPWMNFVAESVSRSGSGYVLALYERARETKAKTIVELGVMVGQSTHALLKAAIENNGHLTSVEINGESLILVGDAMKSGGLDMSKWTAMHGDDLEVAKEWTIPIEFLLIDTSHEYEQTLNELEAYSKFIVPQGVIVLHDTYGNLKVGDKIGSPVKTAIDDWLKLHGEWEFQDITPPKNGWGLGLLRRKHTKNL